MEDLTGVSDGHSGPSLELRVDPGISDGTWKEGPVRFTLSCVQNLACWKGWVWHKESL